MLWSAYPHIEDGPKVVVLPKSFRRLGQSDHDELLSHLKEVAPGVHITGTALLQIPMHLLATDRALNFFLDLLTAARTLADRDPDAAR